MKLLHGDCLELLPTLADCSVDLVLTDPPYGTTACKWDAVIPLEPMWVQVRRVLKPNGAAVFTASQPFTSALVMSNIREFKYEWAWDKVNHFTNHLNAKHQPMKRHENVLVFASGKTTFNRQMEMRAEPYVSRKSSTYQGETYGKMDRSDYGITRTHMPPCSVLPIKARTPKSYHPTQKPVALMEYLIRTYTNEGETVLDFTMGSGTTGVACMNTGRRFIGIERDDGYFQIAQRRIGEASRMTTDNLGVFG